MLHSPDDYQKNTNQNSVDFYILHIFLLWYTHDLLYYSTFIVTTPSFFSIPFAQAVENRVQAVENRVQAVIL